MSKAEQDGSRHLAAIAAEGITTKAYAEREGLSAGTLYYWRKRLKAEAATESAAPSANRKLVPVQVALSESTRTPCTLTLAPGVHLDLAQLPDPQWLATLAAATTGPVR